MGEQVDMSCKIHTCSSVHCKINFKTYTHAESCWMDSPTRSVADPSIVQNCHLIGGFVKKVSKFGNKSGLMGCKWSSLNAQAVETLCLIQFWSWVNSTFQLLEKGNFSTPKLDEAGGFKCLGHSNWTICSPLSQFCFRIFASFFHLYTPRTIFNTPES